MTSTTTTTIEPAEAAVASSTAAYPVKEECETAHGYKIACEIAHRRTEVLKLSAQYLSEREIARKLETSQQTIHRDLVFLRTQTRQNLAYYLYHDFPLRFRKCLTGLEGIIKVMSEIMENPKSTADERIKAAMIKSDTILKIIDLSDNLDAPALKSAYNFIARQKKDYDNNEFVLLSNSSLTERERKEHDDQRAFENAVKQSAHNAVERAAIENDETRPMF
jgi:IS30 family transposase